AGCSSANLGQIDETVDDREEMAGPGIFSDDDGETALKWSNDPNQLSPKPEQSNVAVLDEKAEFEQFKIWNQLRTNAPDSAEYQEFLQWLEYRAFKSGQ
ncbi:MAG: hypothetical protein O6927_09940, partial [Gammaproteobacteria bacterium]|nr:hypothetical protein [Gammaproteobacteria bacterium]